MQGLVSAADIDAAAGRVLAAKFRLGVFDAPEQVPFSAIPASAIGSDAHLALALEAAQKSALHAMLNIDIAIAQRSDTHARTCTPGTCTFLTLKVQGMRSGALCMWTSALA